MIKISNFAVIWDLIIKEEFTKYNINIILIKTNFTIKMTEFEDYKEIDLHIY